MFDDRLDYNMDGGASCNAKRQFFAVRCRPNTSEQTHGIRFCRLESSFPSCICVLPVAKTRKCILSTCVPLQAASRTTVHVYSVDTRGNLHCKYGHRLRNGISIKPHRRKRTVRVDADHACMPGALSGFLTRQVAVSLRIPHTRVLSVAVW